MNKNKWSIFLECINRSIENKFIDHDINLKINQWVHKLKNKKNV